MNEQLNKGHQSIRGKQFSNAKLQTTPINHVSKVYKVKEPFISLFRSQKVCSLNN